MTQKLVCLLHIDVLLSGQVRQLCRARKPGTGSFDDFSNLQYHILTNRGISTRQVGRVVATLTGEVVSPQTVSKLTRDLDEAVRQFHSGVSYDLGLALAILGS